MVQNKNKLIDHLAGNLATAVVHKVLEQAASDEHLKQYYAGEVSNSLERAKGYRERINPVGEPLPGKDADEIRERVIRGAAAELKLRIARGYRDVNLEMTNEVAEKILAGLKIINS